MRLRGKVVLVTGAAGGIGHAVSTLFAKERATVFASDLTPPKKPHADGVEPVTLDVTSEAAWAENCRLGGTQERPPGRPDQQCGHDLCR